MYKDIINYKLADGITEEHLLKVAGQILSEWMKDLDGFLGWEINKNNTGGYTDIVSWESKEAALAANEEMKNIPNSMDWYACYKMETIKSHNVTLLGKF
jgi:hypothetical protein